MTVYFAIKIKYFKNVSFLLRFGSVIGDLNHRNRLSPSYISIFCYRRLAEVSLIVFMSSYPYAQIQLMVVSCVLTIILFGYSNSYLMP